MTCPAVAVATAWTCRAWQTRDEATTTTARRLGFRRTGSKIVAAFKSAINAAIRRGLVERDGPDMIRRAR